MLNERIEITDVWSEWLLHRRHADDPAYAQVVQAAVERYADRVLDGAQLAAGMTLVDVGAGEGLLAFRALDRVGPSLRVILTDLSAPMLRYAESMALRRNVRRSAVFSNVPRMTSGDRRCIGRCRGDPSGPRLCRRQEGGAG